MRKVIYTALTVLTFIVCTPRANAGWFFNDDHQHEQELQQQLDQKQHTQSGLEIVILVLAVGVVLAGITGTIIGSRTRRAVRFHVLPGE